MTFFNRIFSPAYGYARAIACIVIGLVMALWPDMAAKTLVVALGIVLIIVGGVSIAVSYKESDSLFGNIMSFNGLFSILFGLVLVLFTDFFISLIMYIFGLLFIVFGISELSGLISAGKYSKIPFGYFILPVLVTVCGFILLFKPFQVERTIFMFTGCALIVYGLSELFATLKVKKVYKSHQIEDTEYEEVSSETLNNN
ncbi:MAG: DUF308 domain-containing protein [Bacteroidales bacterium]|nr:DUF308 domain-containing protein [Bacteroidales bacterium]